MPFLRFTANVYVYYVNMLHIICYFVVGPCATNCDTCDTNGPGKCDTSGCASGNTYNTATNLCDGECFDGCVVWTHKAVVFFLVSCIFRKHLLKGFFVNLTHIQDIICHNKIISHKYFVCYFCIANLSITWMLFVHEAITLLCL